MWDLDLTLRLDPFWGNLHDKFPQSPGLACNLVLACIWGPPNLMNPDLTPRPSTLEPPNYPLIYPIYPLLSAIRTPLKGPWGVLNNP